ncbi:MAG: T9SS type A sorting domain-containing protein [Bacteroidia bacterium]
MVSSGTINAFAGNGTSGFSGDGGPAVNAELSACSGIAVNQCGGLYIVDRSNSRIRKVSSFNFSATSANVKCFAACTGSIGSSATGGLAPYTYSWSALGSGSVHTNVCAGNYLGICTDSKGCKEQISMNITQFPQLVLSVNQQTNVTCNNNGKAIGSVSGGAGAPHTFTWSTSSSTTSIGSNLSAGIQTVSVDDANGCIATQTFNILFTPTLGLTVQFTDKICGSLGSATATANGTGPITYSWSSSASTGSVVSSLNIGNYSVMATDGNGCSNTQSFAIALNTPSFASVPICFVTVDSLSQNNVIIWDKTSFPSADSFFVYREIGSNVYKKIQAQSYNQLSQFVDTVKTLYFPNTGNPNVGTYRYKIKTIDTCGGASEFSPYHNTLFLINNNGTFTWSQFYEIEGETNPVLSYILERDDFSTGNWVAVGSVAGTQQFVIDPNYSSFIGTASWRVRTQWNINCQASKGVSAGNASYSNKVTNNDVGLDERLNKIQMSVFPNPTSGKFVIQLNSKNEDKQINKIEIVNLLGGVVYLVEGNLSPNTNIDLGAEDNGIYFCKISIDNQILVKKIVLAK